MALAGTTGLASRAPFIFIIILAAWLAGCGSDPTPPGPANRAPLALGTIPAQEINVGDTARVDASEYFTDPDGDALEYAATSSDDAVANSSVSGSMIAITALAKGTARLTVTAADPEGLTAQQSFEVAVPNRAPSAVGTMPAREVRVGDTVMVDASEYFTDPDGDALDYTAASSDTSVAIVSASGSAIAITALAKGTATLTVTAADPEALWAQQSFEVAVPNRAPSAVGTMPAREVHVGDTAIVDVSEYFTDPDGDTLNYTAASSDTSVAMVSASGSAIVIMALAKGTVTLTVTAADPEALWAQQSFQVTVPNRAPSAVGTIPPWVIRVGDTAMVDVSEYFTDPDGDALDYTTASSDTSVAIVSASGSAIAITALAKGTVTLTVTAADPEALWAQQSFEVTVPNRSPSVVGTIPTREISVGDTAMVDVSEYFTDPDGDALDYTVASSDDAVATSSVSGSMVAITALAKGTVTLTVTATDPEGLSARQSLVVTVPNRAPSAVGTMPTREIGVGNTARMDVSEYFSDPDGDALSYEAASADTSVAVVSVSGSEIAITTLAKGTATLTVTATDPEGLSARQSFVVTVPNRAPAAVGTMPGREISVGDTAMVKVSEYFTDPDGDTLKYRTASSDDAVATTPGLDRLIAIKALAKGTAAFTVTATDPEGLSARQSFVVTVPNRAPSAVGTMPTRQIRVGDTVRVDVSEYFTDPDGDALSYEAASANTSVAVVSVSGSEIAITTVAIGTATLTVTATDPEGLSARQTFEATVPNRAPAAVGTMPAQVVQVGGTATMDVSEYFTDPDGDTLSYSASVSIPAIAGTSVVGSIVTVRGLQEGRARLTVTATDGYGMSATQEAPLTVSVADRIVISPERPRVFGSGEEVPFSAVVFDMNGGVVQSAPVNWSSSTPAVATVSSEGVVAIRAQGTATVTATSGLASASVEILVGPPAIRQEYEALRAIHEQLGGPSWKESTNWSTNHALDTWSGIEIDGGGFVTGLRLAENDLAGRLPSEIGAFTRLAHLDMDLNRQIVGPIPAEIGNLESLEFLKLSSTGVSGPIPGEIGRLARLRYLLLHWTELTRIPREIGELTNLEVFHGFLSEFRGSLPVTISSLGKLRELWLNGNRLSGTIPPGIGEMTALEALHLHDNRLSGSIPPGLADAPNLSVLRLTGNRLTGQLPPELGRARNLRWLALEGNQLSGPIPPEIGGARRLTVVNLSRNRLSGSIPPDIGRLTLVERMTLSNNPDLTGPLPVELTGMQNLSVLLLSGTDVCAPADPEFLAWLRSLSQAYVRRCVDTDGSLAYLTQAVQSPHYPVPLIAGDSALLRVFVASEKGAQANASIPPARATFYLGGTRVRVVDFEGTSTPIPAVLDEGRLDLSLNAVIPGLVVQPGMELVVEIDPEGTLDPALGVAERIPESGRAPVYVVEVPTYELTFITFLWTEDPDSALLAKVNGLTPDSPLLWATREFLPVNEVSVTRHDPIWLNENPSASIMGQIINATHAARQAAGGRGHWVGVWSGCCGGASFQIQTAGVGLEPTAPDRFWQNNNVIAHELGHLMTLPHAPCNVGDPDPDFPHPNGSIGSWGYDMRTNELRDPASPEVMSYCGEREKWISGYYQQQALEWRRRSATSESQPGRPVRSLMLWGGFHRNGELVLEPAFVLDAVPTPSVRAGPYRITGWDRQGRVLFSHSLTMSPVDGGGTVFSLMLPVQQEWDTTLDRIELTGPGGSAEVLRNGPTASVLLTDPRTGRIRGFLRHALDLATLADTMQAGAVLRALLPEPGLVPQVSRGIPAAEVWRR